MAATQILEVATEVASVAQQLAQLVATLPADAVLEVLHFAEYTAARARWDVALESTTPEQTAKIRERIASQRTQATPLFNDAGEVAAPQQA